MTPDELFRSIRDTLVAFTGSWSANKVYYVASGYDLKMRRQEALERIRFVCGESCAKPGPKKRSGTELPTPSGTEPGTELRSVPASLSPRVSSPTPPSSVTSISLFTDPNGSDAAAPKTPKLRTKRAQKPPDTAWVEPMKAAVRALFPRHLEDLDSEERFALAMLHGYRFGNCTLNEGRNRSHARKIASGLANLARDKDYRSLTVAQYIKAGDAAYKRGGERPMFSPWEVVGAVERV